MQTYFSINTQREFCGWADITYKAGILHPERPFPFHHDFVYMIKGTWDFVAGEERTLYKVHPGDVFVLPAWYYHGPVNLCTPGTNTYFIHALPVDGDSNPKTLQESNDISSLSLNTVIHCQNNALIKDLFAEIIHVLNSDRTDKEIIASSILNTLICFLHKRDTTIIVNSSDVVDECIEIMQNEPSVMFKTAEIAKKVFVSEVTLRSYFEKRFNKTFYQYQLDYKLSQTKALLSENKSLKIHEIALELGFCDGFHLSKLFKQKYGISPSEYKKISELSIDKKY